MSSVGCDSGEDAKSAWKKLRNNHRDALRRHKHMNKSGAAATDIKPWKFEAQMELLLQYMVNENRGTNFTSDDNNAEVEELTEQLLDEEAVDNPDEQVVGEFDGLLRQNKADVGEATITNEPTNVPLVKPPSSTNKPTNAPSEKPPSAKKPRRMKKGEIDSLIVMAFELREQRQRDQERKAMAAKIALPNDDLYLFFMSMYELTKKNASFFTTHLPTGFWALHPSEAINGLINRCTSSKSSLLRRQKFLNCSETQNTKVGPPASNCRARLSPNMRYKLCDTFLPCPVLPCAPVSHS
ncbi:hypothetical protein J6590_100662 [Homalodisca vitripennis]|nr:hypothetical protein J6590_100662 [Homalodisca vitripennis]